MKKTFKKLTAVLLAVCLTLSVLSLTAVSAAETDSAAAGMDPILLEYTGTYTYDLTATADGLMCVSCYGDDEIYITDTEDNWINGYDDNLFVIFAVKAGQSYVIHLRSFDDDETHTCTISRLDVAPLRFQESEKIDLAAGCVRYFSFVPVKDMAYGFLGYNAKDYNFKISIFDDSFKTVFTESSCLENSFRKAAELTKGKTYYIFAGVKDEQPGSYDLVADNADALLPGIARSVTSSEGDGSSTASFHAAEDADMLLRVSSSSSYASAVLNVKDSKGETVVSRDYGDKNVRSFDEISVNEISVKKGEDYSITFDYTGSNGYCYFYFELNRLDDIVSGKEFEAGNDNVIYRYVTTKDCVIKLTSSLDKYFIFNIYDSDFNYYTNNVIAQAGDRFYMLFTDEGKYTVSEMYEEIRVNETKDVEITSEFRLQPYIFKPEESGYYHYYSTDAEGAYCEIYAQDKSKENLIGGNRPGINKDFNVTFYANEGNVYYLFNCSSKEYDDYSVTIEKGAPVAIVDDVFMGDFNAKGEYKVPSHYNPPYDPANPDKYLDKDAEGAREVTEIAYWALAVNSDLVKVDIPDTVKKIGDLAFYYSSNLEEVRFSENLETIGNQAFANCRKLRSVTLPDSVTQMGPGVFRYSGVEEIKLSANLKAIPMEAFVGCSSLRSITIPASVESVGYYAFEYCRSLSKATVEDGVKELSDNAFVGCSSLKEITVPKSVTTIGKYAIGYSENGTYDENYNFNRDRYEDFVIRGYKGTEAERYANENGFRFVALDGAEPNPTEYGDANGDGKIDVTDATEIQKFAADMVKFNDAQLKFADANKDGKITVDDTTMVQKYAAGLIKSFD